VQRNKSSLNVIATATYPWTILGSMVNVRSSITHSAPSSIVGIITKWGIYCDRGLAPRCSPDLNMVTVVVQPCAAIRDRAAGTKPTRRQVKKDLGYPRVCSDLGLQNENAVFTSQTLVAMVENKSKIIHPKKSHSAVCNLK